MHFKINFIIKPNFMQMFFSGRSTPKKDVSIFFETLKTTNPIAQRHITEEMDL